MQHNINFATCSVFTSVFRIMTGTGTFVLLLTTSLLLTCGESIIIVHNRSCTLNGISVY